MVYSKYGHTFRKIREQKKLSLSIFPKIGISKPALSKFERGETMMGFESVVCALQEMGVTLEEYENLLNFYSSGEEEALWEEIEHAAQSEDKKKLEDLEEYTLASGLHFMSLAAKACHSRLNNQEIEEVTEYLYDIDMWSFTELRVFYFTLDTLSPRDISHILRTFFPKGHELFKSRKHRKYFFQICCRAITFFSVRGYQKEAKILLEQLEAHDLAQTMFQRNLKNITAGYWTYQFVDPREGRKQVDDGLEILRTTNSLEEFYYYKKRYNFQQ